MPSKEMLNLIYELARNPEQARQMFYEDLADILHAARELAEYYEAVLEKEAAQEARERMWNR